MNNHPTERLLLRIVSSLRILAVVYSVFVVGVKAPADEAASVAD